MTVLVTEACSWRGLPVYLLGKKLGGRLVRYMGTDLPIRRYKLIVAFLNI